jgi:2',3'-cyclic-nucleotide 2'-phosphodiesterase
LQILTIGDVVGEPGRKAVQEILPGLINELSIEFVVANGENAAGGLGITVNIAYELFHAGVDVITTGNHIWAKREIIPFLDGQLPIIRPLNFPPGVPGKGYCISKNIMVVNLIGRVFVGDYDCPFRTMDSFLANTKPDIKVIIVDFHAEATSEKIALGRYLDGRVTALVGTHTHVGTSDYCVLPKGTAYVTDIGMVGPDDSVIGDDTQSVIQSFLTKMPHRISVGKGRASFSAMAIDVDEASGKAREITRIYRGQQQH